jgi:hypothetical protein
MPMIGLSTGVALAELERIAARGAAGRVLHRLFRPVAAGESEGNTILWPSARRWS